LASSTFHVGYGQTFLLKGHTALDAITPIRRKVNCRIPGDERKRFNYQRLQTSNISAANSDPVSSEVETNYTIFLTTCDSMK
jgi:hypothetical protein